MGAPLWRRRPQLMPPPRCNHQNGQLHPLTFEAEESFSRALGGFFSCESTGRRNFLRDLVTPILHSKRMVYVTNPLVFLRKSLYQTELDPYVVVGKDGFDAKWPRHGRCQVANKGYGRAGAARLWCQRWQSRPVQTRFCKLNISGGGHILIFVSIDCSATTYGVRLWQANAANYVAKQVA